MRDDRFSMSRSFLATDRVPETIFGIPVVSRPEQYTEADLAFFREHPEAGGYYDLGDGAPETPRQASKAGDAIEGATLSDDRPMHFFRDDDGKIAGYGTTRSIVHEDNGKFFVIPTILDDGAGGTRAVGDSDAIGWYSETGEHWGGYRTRKAAETAAEALHEKHQKMYGKKWNEYVQLNWDDIADSVKSDPGVAALRRLRTGPYPGSWNNPGNVQKGEAEYDGESGTVKGKLSEGDFLTFNTPRDGLNAMGQAVGQMIREKLPAYHAKGKIPDARLTVSNLIHVYAPPEDSNDTKDYVKFVTDKLGVGKDQTLDMDDAGTMADLLEAMVRRDSGHSHADWFPRADYLEAARKMKVPAKTRGKEKGGK